MMNSKTATDVARARVLPRWNAAFRQERYYHESYTGQRVPFTIEQCAAIRSGATVLDMGTHIKATIEGGDVLIDGNLFTLKTGMVEPEDLLVASGRDSMHMDLNTILMELEITTGIEACRWMIDVDKRGRIEVDIAPSEAYVASEIRKCSVTDFASLAQWLLKYDVKATRTQLCEMFGPGAATLGPHAGHGYDTTVIRDFYAPLNVHFHSKRIRGVRKMNARGVDTISKVLSLAPGGVWYLHGVPLMRFDDVAIWRCCTHSNTDLHLYDEPHAGPFMTRSTIAGTLKLPTTVSPKAFVPYPTVSGNMFGDFALVRPSDVVATAPQTLNRIWLTKLNANNDVISFDHARLMLEALETRYGRGAALDAICEMMMPGQATVLKMCLAKKRMPRNFSRHRYFCYVKTIQDMLNGTDTAPKVRATIAGGHIDVPRALTWSRLTEKIQSNCRVVLSGSNDSAMQAALKCGDFVLEELRTDQIYISVEPVLNKRKR